MNTVRMVVGLITAAGLGAGSTLTLHTSLHGSFGVVENPVSLSNATSANALTDSGALSSYIPLVGGYRGGDTTYSLRSSFGALGIGIELHATCIGSGCGTETARTLSLNSVTFSDTLTILNGPASGFVRMTYQVEGSFASWADTGSDTNQGVWFTVYTDGTPHELLAHSAQANQIYPNSAGPVLVTGTLLIPYINSTMGLSANLQATAICNAFNGSCGAELLFGNTARMGGFKVLDSNLNEVAGASIGAESGYDYEAAMETVPEPGRMAAIPLAVLLAAVWFRGRSLAARS